MKIEKSLLGNPVNPHYFIINGPYSFISEESKLISFMPFCSAKHANKYAKSIGGFAVFATTMNYELLLKFNK